VIEVSGEVDLATAPDIYHRVCALAEVEPVVVLDMSRVTFVDSSGLGTLVMADKRLKDALGELRIVITHPSVQRVFDMTDLYEILSIFGSVTEALDPLPAHAVPMLAEAT
jgi:anti-sigma B factor antagonist